MKLVHLFKIYWPDNAGGIGRSIETVADSYEKWSKEKTDNEKINSQEIIVCRSETGLPPRKDQYRHVPVYRCRMQFDFASTPFSPQLLKIAKKRTKDADIVMYHFPYPVIDFGILLGLFRGKLVVWWHCDFATSRFASLARLYRPLVRHTLKKADRIITCAEGNINGSDTLRPFKDKCVVIPHAVDDRWAAEGRKYYENRKPGHTNKVNIIFIGRFVWYKGIDILLKAYRHIQKKEYSLTLVGDGPLLGEMKQLASRLGLRNVTFTGSVTDEEKMEHIRNSDFMVLPSVSEAESFAIVQIEVMAFGKPVINTRLASGVPEVSPDGISGITVEPGNIKQLCKAMKELAENEKLREIYSMQAVRLVEERHRMDRMQHSYMELFEELSQNM